MTSQSKSFNWLSLLVGILFIATAIMSFKDPTGSLASITIFIGIIALIKGISDITIRNKLKKYTGKTPNVLLVVGILDIVFGIILLTNVTVGMIALPFIFAIWFIVDSISGLFSLDIAKSVSTAYYWLCLILNIVGIFLGISLFFDPIASALTLSFIVGFYLMLIGIVYIVHAFTNDSY
ncbi:HdeD family acid-resistance protein [Vagococcus vulneris]|uniref:Acid-resistance membrane protein n=1 Tax=Vagococcus vulneris TaxID=1977869 RepID=A0A429ZUL0_9ENTE|nr:DUF308 domain-containing protein [Vagococcus vulneris]RST97388.1 hypothetical protein CBF37_09920 [Vagococcus vulneris]